MSKNTENKAQKNSPQFQLNMVTFSGANTNMFNSCQMNTNEEDRNKYFGGT